MFGMLVDVLLILAFVAAWIGHACTCTAILNHLYGRPLSKKLLKPFRLIVGGVILAFPLLLASAVPDYALFAVGAGPQPQGVVRPAGAWGLFVVLYTLNCLAIGLVVFPLLTLGRLLRKPPPAVVAESTHTLDLWAELGQEAIGDGKFQWVARLPLNCVFRVDFTDLALALPDLPPTWDGLTILLVSDVHFHGTPSRRFFERVIDEIETRWPTPDLVCLGGDYVDTDTHREWIAPLLGRLRANEAKLAILGNHDEHHEPDKLRDELTATGYSVLGNGWREVTIRGDRCVVVGHEGPWFSPPPDLSRAPTDAFRLCLSHTPDNFYWGVRNRVRLMLCGHVHGGQVRIPVIGSIFVPSIYSRRFDMGVFAAGDTVMVTNRGLSGKEPLRFRCNTQVLRITLRRMT